MLANVSKRGGRSPKQIAEELGRSESRKRKLVLREKRRIPTEDLMTRANDYVWYALAVPPQKEFAAQVILDGYGLASYVPVRRDWRRRNKYTKTKELHTFPIAPRYVFTAFPRGVPLWFDLFALPLINGAVGINGEPKRLQVAPLVRLMRQYPNGIIAPAEQKYMATGSEFKVGDTVRVVDGPFAGMSVPVINIEGPIAKVGLQMFGGAVTMVELSLELLEAA